MSVDEIVQGLCGTACSAMFSGHNVFAAGIGELRRIMMEDVEAVAINGDAKCAAYFVLSQGA